MIVPPVFQHRAFVFLWIDRVFGTIAAVMQSVAIGWLVYSVSRQTHDERTSMLLVGMIGLVQFLPMFALTLIAGEMADRYDRRLILFWCIVAQTLCAGAFTIASMQPHVSLTAIFTIAAFFGSARAFMMPAGQSIVPLLVPDKILPNAIAWNSLAFQTGAILGPWLGGALCAVNPAAANAGSFVLFIFAGTAAFLLLKIPMDIKPHEIAASRMTMIREGLKHLWGSKVVLGAISLDLFAVLLGGVTALLPAYARDVLQIGPAGFGLLRSAFAIGSGAMTLTLAFNPIRRHAGLWMLGGVSVFGFATLCFAVSQTLMLSMLMLALAGAADSISVFTRQSLVQIVTPNAMRGRVASVSTLFIGASNELGEFESGVAARLLGIVGSAIFGGVGSIAVTALWAKIFPALRKADHLVPKTAQISPAA